MKKKKVLIIRFSSIGDIVLTTPVIRAVKTQLDGAEVHFCTKADFKILMENNPYLDKVHLLDGRLSTLINTLRREKFDFIIDLHNNLRTRIIKAALWGVKSKSFNKLNWEKWLLVKFKINKLPNVHIVDRYIEAAAPLGVKKDNFGLDYFIPEKDEVELSWLPKTHRKGYIAYVIGAQHQTKKLPLKRMIELCDKINKPIVLIGGKEDKDTAEKITQFFERSKQSAPYEDSLDEMNKKTRIFNACGLFNLNQSASLIRQAQLVFSHDTGMMHIAAAFRKTIYSVWGNTIPMFGMYPYNTKFTILENNKAGCRPCSKIGYQQCPKGHFDCMNKIVFDFWIP